MPIRPVVDIAYKTGDKLGQYEAQRCKLDLYLPRGGKISPRSCGSTAARSAENEYLVAAPAAAR